MHTLCLTGWQQERDALATLAPDAVHFDYDAYDNLEKMLSALPPTPDLAIGWSLGGQLLVRAIAGGYMHPKRLVLLGVPFQCIADAHFSDGITAADFQEVRNNYVRNPEAMLANFQTLMATGDKEQAQIARNSRKEIPLWNNGLFWLDDLSKATCHNLDYASFPETHIVHGQNDHVIHPESAVGFHGQIPRSKLFLLPDCGHALHLHSLQGVF